jgi:hypothetical protein
MARLDFPPSRQLDLTWNGETFVLRLLEDRAFITPKLPFTESQYIQLLRCQPVQLGEWVTLGHLGPTLTIKAKDRPEWEAKWTAFYKLVQALLEKS